jgi:hypothetical protein
MEPATPKNPFALQDDELPDELSEEDDEEYSSNELAEEDDEENSVDEDNRDEEDRDRQINEAIEEGLEKWKQDTIDIGWYWDFKHWSYVGSEVQRKFQRLGGIGDNQLTEIFSILSKSQQDVRLPQLW